MESIAAINDGSGDVAHHAHSHHEERPHHHEEAEDEEDIGGEHIERGSEQVCRLQELIVRLLRDYIEEVYRRF